LYSALRENTANALKHVLQKEEIHLQKEILTTNTISCQRRRGKPRTGWKDNITKQRKRKPSPSPLIPIPRNS